MKVTFIFQKYYIFITKYIKYEKVINLYNVIKYKLAFNITNLLHK